MKIANNEEKNATALFNLAVICEERGEKPDKPYSGKFNLRISPVLHARLDLTAKSSGESLNSFVAKTLEKAVGE